MAVAQALEKPEAEITEAQIVEDVETGRFAAMVAHLRNVAAKKTEPEKAERKKAGRKKAEPEKTRSDMEIPEGELKERLDAHKEWEKYNGEAGKRFNGADQVFMNIDFAGYTLERAFLPGVQFVNCAYGSKSSLRGVRAPKSIWENCNLYNTPVDSANFEGAQFIDCKVQKKNFVGSQMNDVLVTKDGKTLPWDDGQVKKIRKAYTVTQKRAAAKAEAEARLSGGIKAAKPVKPAAVTPEPIVIREHFSAPYFEPSAKNKVLVSEDLYAPLLGARTVSPVTPQDDFEAVSLSSHMAAYVAVDDDEPGTEEPGEDATTPQSEQHAPQHRL
ncbi:MAG: hypothetical protein WBK55_06875 [Alphaproteobacteria bacterium]